MGKVMTDEKPMLYYRDGHCLSNVLLKIRDRGDPQAKHVCGDYDVVARCVAETWDRDSQIIVDAFNTHHETGLTPRQLAEQRDELLAALKAASEFLGIAADTYDSDPLKRYAKKAKAAIARAEGGAK